MTDFKEPQEDFASHRLESSELASDWEQVEPSVSRLRQRIEEATAPDRASQAALQRTLVSLVREEVSEGHRENSLRVQWSRRLRDLSATWRELAAASTAFRWASQGTLALGLGLLLASIVHLGLEEGARAENERVIEEQTTDAIPSPLLYEEEDEGLEEAPRDTLPDLEPK